MSCSRYEKRFSRVIAYLHNNLAQELDLNQLADIACMSPYHWHRIYSSYFAESIVATVKRLRLQKAADLLAKTKLKIGYIGELSGYPNLQSFTRIFSSVYGMPPARYRLHGSHTQFELSTDLNMSTERRNLAMFPVQIQQSSGHTLLGVAHQGAYMGISQAFDHLSGLVATRRLYQAGAHLIGVYVDDPSRVAQEDLRSYACITVTPEIQISHALSPLHAVFIVAGKYAVLRYQGPYSDMQAAYQWLFGVWLPNSGEEAADSPAFEDYINNPRDTLPPDLLTDIYLPLL
ncbi:MAG: AraC family transcriptional regulator [Undibacterium sp.]|nr:AraC family transcriptional regulator [Undibacterium sp.]